MQQPAPRQAITASRPAVTGSQPAVPGPGTPGTPGRAATGTRTPGIPASALEPENLRAWIANLDRKLGIRTYIGAAAVVLCLAAAAVAIVLAVDARDNSASDDDLNEIESQLSVVSEQSESAATATSDIDDLDARLSTLETQVNEAGASGGVDEKRITVIEDDIDDLRQQISDLRADGGSSSGGTSP